MAIGNVSSESQAPPIDPHPLSDGDVMSEGPFVRIIPTTSNDVLTPFTRSLVYAFPEAHCDNPFLEFWDSINARCQLAGPDLDGNVERRSYDARVRPTEGLRSSADVGRCATALEVRHDLVVVLTMSFVEVK